MQGAFFTVQMIGTASGRLMLIGVYCFPSKFIFFYHKNVIDFKLKRL